MESLGLGLYSLIKGNSGLSGTVSVPGISGVLGFLTLTLGGIQAGFRVSALRV